MPQRAIGLFSNTILNPCHKASFCVMVLVSRWLVLLAPTLARHFYSVLASRADAEHGEGIMHAVLALAAQHKSNLARVSDDDETSLKFADVSLQHRSEAFHFLRTTAAVQDEQYTAVVPVILILLVLTMVGQQVDSADMRR